MDFQQGYQEDTKEAIFPMLQDIDGLSNTVINRPHTDFCFVLDSPRTELLIIPDYQ